MKNVTAGLTGILCGSSIIALGCATSGDHARSGIILVGTPEVSSRERLVNDRLVQDRWLRDYLANSDKVSFDDFQGLVDERTMTALSINASINADPNQLAAYDAESANYLESLKQKGELGGLDQQIAILEKQKKLAELRKELEAIDSDSATGGSDDQSGSNGADSAADSTAATPPVRPSSPASDLAGKLLERLSEPGRSKLLPDPSSLASTKAKSSPIEALRDRLAYREEIRNEILENQLDDRHDLTGNTLYRLNVDSTLIPDSANDSWAIIDMVLEGGNDERATSQLYEEWLMSFHQFFERAIESSFSRTVKCLGQIESAVTTAIEGTTDACGLGFDELEDLLAYSRSPLSSSEKYGLPASGLTAYPRLDETATGPQMDEIVQRVARDFQDVVSQLARKVSGKGDGPGAGAPVTKQEMSEALAILVAVKVRSDYFDRRGLGRYLSSPAIGKLEPCPGPPRADQGLVKWCSHDASSLTLENPLSSQSEVYQKRFQEALERAWHVYAYAATPKESVQRISRVSAARSTMELAAALGALSGAASLDAAVGYIRENQRLLQAILREPLVVGYTEAGEVAKDMTASLKANLGWLVGPPFVLKRKPLQGESVAFAHRPVQNSLAATVSVPGWWKRAKVTISTCWKRREAVGGSAAVRCEEQDSLGKRTHSIELPGRISAITDILLERREPVPYSWRNYVATNGQEASLLIEGENLWRSTEVTLGAQTADSIKVLPDMAGIVATFSPVKEPAGLDGKSPRGPVEVMIWTSAGNQRVGTATIYPGKEKKEPPLKVAFKSGPVFKGDKVAVELTSGKIPPGYFALKLLVRGRDDDKGKWTDPIQLTALQNSSNEKVVEAVLTDPGANIKSGMEIQVSLAIQVRPDAGDGDSEVRAEALGVYYTSKDETEIKFAPASVKLGETVTLSFPKNATSAFPGFSAKPSLSFDVWPTGANFTVKAGDPTWASKDGRETLTVKVEPDTGTWDETGAPALVILLKPLPEGLSSPAQRVALKKK